MEISRPVGKISSVTCDLCQFNLIWDFYYFGRIKYNDLLAFLNLNFKEMVDGFYGLFLTVRMRRLC